MDDIFLYHRRVYFADTDAGGIAYHANYLRWCEEARSEWLYDLGIDYQTLIKEDCLFVITSANLVYRKPADLGDKLTIETQLQKHIGTRYFFLHTIKRDDVVLATIELVAATVTAKGRPRKPSACLAPLGNKK